MTGTKRSLSSEILTRLSAAYEGAADAERARPMRAYMRDQFPFLGLTRAVRDELDRGVLAGLGAPTEDDLARVARASWKKSPREYQYFGQKYLRRWVPKIASPAFVSVIEELVVTKSWWDTVDDLAQHPLGSLVQRHPALKTTMDAWAESEDLWLARAAILHQNRYREATDEKRLFAYCEARATEKDFFMRKGIGWALRQYAATAPEAVATFVQRHDAMLSPLSKREAMRGVTRARGAST